MYRIRQWLARLIAPVVVTLESDLKFRHADHWGNVEIVFVDRPDDTEHGGLTSE